MEAEHPVSAPALEHDGPEIRECHLCPPQVRRCIHFGDEILAFTSHVFLPEFEQHRKLCNPAPYAAFDVGITSRYAPCKGGCGAIFATRPGRRVYMGESHDDALAAFYAAEEALRRADA